MGKVGQSSQIKWNHVFLRKQLCYAGCFSSRFFTLVVVYFIFLENSTKWYGIINLGGKWDSCAKIVKNSIKINNFNSWCWIKSFNRHYWYSHIHKSQKTGRFSISSILFINCPTLPHYPIIKIKFLFHFPHSPVKSCWQ